MEIAIALVVLVAGVIVGAFAAWLAIRGQKDLSYNVGKAEGEVERTVLVEQLKASNARNSELNGELIDLKSALDSARANAEQLGVERAQFAERASAVDDLKREKEESQKALERVTAELMQAREDVARLAKSEEEKQRQISELQAAEKAQRDAAERFRRDAEVANETIARLKSELEAERKQSEEKGAFVLQAREELAHQFRALAAEIMDEKSKKFTDLNQTNLDSLLTPLREKLTTFQSKVEQLYVNEAKDRSALFEQVKMLTDLNATLREETQNLTLALTGDPKAQGDYGELLLDDVLERAGLREGQHYTRQGSVKSEDGTNAIPDVVLHMPGDRHLVVDSKMRLPDYKLFTSTRDESEREVLLRNHLDAIRRHIKGLSAKNYQALYGLQSLDFVVMFIPLEPAFMVAVTNDRDLFQHAWEKNILLVSPSTLLFVVRTVHNLWRQEEVSRNAKAISARGAQLYDKLVGFVEDLLQVGQRLDQAQNAYLNAKRKLSEGPGNVVRQAEMLRQLGVKPGNRLPGALTVDLGIEADAGVTIATDDQSEVRNLVGGGPA